MLGRYLGLGVQGLQPCGRRSIRLMPPFLVDLERSLLAAFARLWFGLQLVLLDLRCGLQPVLDRVGVVEGGRLDSRTLGDAGVHWPGFFDLQSWTSVLIRTPSSCWTSVALLADICQALDLLQRQGVDVRYAAPVVRDLWDP